MKVLFICRVNVGRSQMAEAIFNKFSEGHLAISAGLNPPKKWEGKLLSKTKYVAPCMAEIGLDVSNKVSKKLTETMVSDVDRIIVIGEKDNWPIFLKNSCKVTYWDIVDPDTGGIKLHRIVRDQIKSTVENFIREIN